MKAGTVCGRGHACTWEAEQCEGFASLCAQVSTHQDAGQCHRGGEGGEGGGGSLHALSMPALACLWTAGSRWRPVDGSSGLSGCGGGMRGVREEEAGTAYWCQTCVNLVSRSV